MARITWICAGASSGILHLQRMNLTGSVSFNFYADEFKGIHIEPVQITRPNDDWLDVYWQDGPAFRWGAVVARFPDGTPAIVEGQSGKGFVIFTASTWRLRKVARVNEFQNSGEWTSPMRAPCSKPP